MAEELNGAVVETTDAPGEQTRELIGIEVAPIGPSEGECAGGVVRLVKMRPDGEPTDEFLACGMSPQQLRVTALHMLAIADGASKNQERTVVAVTQTAMWALPGQALVARFDPGLVCDFVVKMKDSRLATPPRGLVGFGGAKKGRLVRP